MTYSVRTAVEIKNVTIRDEFWSPRLKTNRTVTLPIEYGLLKSTGRLESLDLGWKPGKPRKPHIFWDSDIAKWLEAAAYSLILNPDPELEARCDRVIRRLEKVQRPDGYLNTYFTSVEPGRRWTNLEECHELYCMGHLTEAAVAYRQATGKDRFLNVMRRYADHIDRTFGRGKGKRRGYCGHPEVELALVRLYRETGERRYLKLAAYFVNERGRKPLYFDLERRRLESRGIGSYWGERHGRWPDREYYLIHKPVRDQTDAIGHAVRALYLYSAMADVAVETRDAGLLRACRKLWESATLRRMYVTAGVGSSRNGERFTSDFDLPNETAYAETCAAIALIFFSRRMSLIEGDARYADAMELSLYNASLAGVGVDGKSFTYANPLTVYPAAGSAATGFASGRQTWFDCACCPPNVARLLASLGGYAYSSGPDSLRIELFIAGEVRSRIGADEVRLQVRTRYPWDGGIGITVFPGSAHVFSLELRVPAWCEKYSIRVNGRKAALRVKRGYAVIRRAWRQGDRVDYMMEMPVRTLEANPSVRSDCGKIAIKRGPLIYCLEETDNGNNLADIAVSASARFTARFDPKFPGGGAVMITGRAVRRSSASWKGKLYAASTNGVKSFSFKAVPFALWDNRKKGEMMVWIRRI